MTDRDQRIVDVCFAAPQNRHKPGHRGTHNHGPADYTLTSEQIRQTFRDYLAI